MGRSTTLAYLAYFYYLIGKRVVVLDCDFEAPGVASMFFEKDIREEKAGILDYLIDLNIEKEPKLDEYFLQNEVSNNSGNLYLFPSGIDYDIDNYINKISKIDFNSNDYIEKFQKLLENVNLQLKPDLIFIDLRAGINESNGSILKNISSMNFLFFNSEEQNEDGLRVILNSLKKMENNYIINSTIRFAIEKKELIEFKKNEFKEFINQIKNKNDNIEILQLPFKESMLETNIKEFGDSQYNLYKANSKFYLQDMFNIISNKYFNKDIEVEVLEDEENNNMNIKLILEKLQKEFLKLIEKKNFESEEDLKYFYFKDDISKVVNDQIFLIIGINNYEIFKKLDKSKKHIYIDGLLRTDILFDKKISKFFKTKKNFCISDDALDNYTITLQVVKTLILYYLENYLEIPNKLFKNTDDIYNTITKLKYDKNHFFIESLNKHYQYSEYDILINEKLMNINHQLAKENKFITLIYAEGYNMIFYDKEFYIKLLIEFWQKNLYRYSNIKPKIILQTDAFNKLNIDKKSLKFNIYELKWSKNELLDLLLKTVTKVLNEDELKVVYRIFGKKLNKIEFNIDKESLTPKVAYKLMLENIEKELKTRK